MGNCCGGTAVVEHVQDVQWGRAHPAIKIRGAKAKMSTSDYAYRCAVADVVMHDGQHVIHHSFLISFGCSPLGSPPPPPPPMATLSATTTRLLKYRYSS